MNTLLWTAGLITCLGLFPLKSLADPNLPLKPFLGVHSVSLPPEVRAQTSLGEGAGLMIDFIQPDSPAHRAGFKLYDILLKIADQQLLSVEQFTTLIRANKVGVPINFEVLRQGKPLTLEATLVEAPAQEMTATALSASDQDLLKDAPDAKRTLSLLFSQLGQGPRKQPSLAQVSAATMSMSDTEGTVEISRKDNHQSALVKDPHGKVLFDGPINTPAERNALAAEIRARIEKLEESAQAVSQPTR